MAELALTTSDQRLAIFRKIWAFCTLLLFLFTWRLWTPTPAFPQVPVFEPLGILPSVMDWVLLGVILVSLLTIGLIPGYRVRQQALVLFATALVISMLINQHRFQPWAYQSLLVAVVLRYAADATATKLLRWLIISIYVWSAWSKCDFTFVHNLGQHLLQALLGWCGYHAWPEQVRLFLAACIPLAEAAVALGLCMPKSRRTFVIISIVLHVILIAALGPFGLQHKPGVLIWNLYYIAQNWLLFGGPQNLETSSETPKRALLPCVAIVGALFWPLFEVWSYCDHWPAWSVYAPRVERTLVFVPEGEREKLSTELQSYLEPVRDDPFWLQLRLDRWSLDATDAPLYPQNRFQLAVAASVASKLGISQMRTVRLSSANRLDGQRQSETFSGIGQLKHAIRDYLIGTAVPREWVRQKQLEAE
jgi:hypothetical protein